MSVPALSAADTTAAARYETLIRVPQALGACHDRAGLFRTLTHELRRVVKFDFLSLAIYDERTHTIEPYVLESTGEAVAPPRLAVNESLTYWLVQHQEPLVIPVVEEEARFAQATAYMRCQNMRSACALPLTSPQRRLGMLLAASVDTHTYDAEDVTFLTLVARQVALAIDDALNYGALQEALALERERQRNLDASDGLLRALAGVLDIRSVFPRV